jgi:hypothetical protein
MCIAIPFQASADLWNFEDFSPKEVSFAYRADDSAGLVPSRWALNLPASPPSVVEPALEPEPAEQKSPREFSKIELCSTAASVAKANRLPVPFFTNLIHQESGFKPHVVSPAGAQGIAQFMPRVAASYGLENPFDPIQALAASGKFLAELVARFGNLGLAAAAYNAGPKRVQDWMARRGKLPAETRHYVKNITGRPAEQWTRSAAKLAEASLPARARCPDAGTNETVVATRKSNLIAAGPTARRLLAMARVIRRTQPVGHSKVGERMRNNSPVLAGTKSAVRAAALRVRPSNASKRVRVAAIR